MERGSASRRESALRRRGAPSPRVDVDGEDTKVPRAQPVVRHQASGSARQRRPTGPRRPGRLNARGEALGGRSRQGDQKVRGYRCAKEARSYLRRALMTSIVGVTMRQHVAADAGSRADAGAPGARRAERTEARLGSTHRPSEVLHSGKSSWGSSPATSRKVPGDGGIPASPAASLGDERGETAGPTGTIRRAPVRRRSRLTPARTVLRFIPFTAIPRFRRIL